MQWERARPLWGYQLSRSLAGQKLVPTATPTTLLAAPHANPAAPAPSLGKSGFPPRLALGPAIFISGEDVVRCGALRCCDVQGCWVVCLGPDGSWVPALEALWRPDFSKVTWTRIPRLEGRSLGVGCGEGLRGSRELPERTGGGCRRPGPSWRQAMTPPG